MSPIDIEKSINKCWVSQLHVLTTQRCVPSAIHLGWKTNILVIFLDAGKHKTNSCTLYNVDIYERYKISSSQPISEPVLKTPHTVIGRHEEVSLNEESLNIINCIINLLDFKTLGQIIPDRSVPMYHNSYTQ
jgi:hypothetical protein